MIKDKQIYLVFVQSNFDFSEVYSTDKEKYQAAKVAMKQVLINAWSTSHVHDMSDGIKESAPQERTKNKSETSRITTAKKKKISIKNKTQDQQPEIQKSQASKGSE